MNGEQPPNQNEGTPANPVSSSMSQSINSRPAGQPATEQQLNDVEKRMTAFERSMRRLTIVQVIVAILTGAVIALQWYEMHTGSVDTHALAEAAKAQAEAAKATAESSKAQSENTARQLIISEEQAKAAQGSVQATQRQMRQDQRAWLNPQAVFSAIGESKPIGAVVQVINNGRTPARRIFFELVVEKVSSNKSPSFDYSGPHFKPHIGTMFTNVTQEMKISAFRSDYVAKVASEMLLTKPEYEELVSGQAYVAVFGKMTYLDVFGIEHWAKFCRWKDYSTSFSFFNADKCVEYNDVDNN